MRALLLLLLALAACAPTTPAAMASMQAEVAQEMGITFWLPEPALVSAYDMADDGKTLARTWCFEILNTVQAIQYRADVDWSRNKHIIAHELQHAIQCHTGKKRTMTSAEREAEAEAIERWWRTKFP